MAYETVDFVQYRGHGYHIAGPVFKVNHGGVLTGWGDQPSKAARHAKVEAWIARSAIGTSMARVENIGMGFSTCLP